MVDLVGVLLEQRRIAVDTEFHRERTYHPKVALLQVAWSDGLALVDPGLPGEDSWQVLVQRLDALGARVEHVHTVVVTHSHPDHFGGVHQLRDESGSALLTHADFRSIFGNDESETADDAPQNDES